MSYAENVIDLIGNTPMVKLNRVTEGTKAGKVLVKLEMQNPGGSVKDRIAKSMIEQAEADGLITPGKTTVVEYTSGNTGVFLRRSTVQFCHCSVHPGVQTTLNMSRIVYFAVSTGIGLAMVCAAKGYDCVIVMPQLPPMKERYMICRKFGAQVHLTAGKLGIPGMKTYVDEQLQKNPDWWCPRQFENPVWMATGAEEVKVVHALRRQSGLG